jgi:hypothetical protein
MLEQLPSIEHLLNPGAGLHDEKLLRYFLEIGSSGFIPIFLDFCFIK